jgi:hypothetical protein
MEHEQGWCVKWRMKRCDELSSNSQKGGFMKEIQVNNAKNHGSYYHPKCGRSCRGRTILGKRRRESA